MTSPRTLRDWCRLTCARYPNVEITDMSSSFRDGLAFCALIHKHRPDLIDFSSLSKDHVHHNNKLAFEVAETKLGIPALLDLKDMVSDGEPDSLSVLTYVSQYHQYFSRRTTAGPSGLKSPQVSIFNSLTRSRSSPALRTRKSLSDLRTISEGRVLTPEPRTLCALCLKPVHLIQRLLIEGNIYHRSCSRCAQCHIRLVPSSYARGRDAGVLICSHHPSDGTRSHPDPDHQSECEDDRLSLRGAPVSSVPHTEQTSQSQDGRTVCGTERGDRGDGDVPAGLKRVIKKPARSHRPQTCGQQKTSEGDGPGDRDTRGGERQRGQSSAGPCPVPTPRRMLDPSVGPGPAPPLEDRPPTAENDQDRGSPSSSRSSSSGGSPKVRTNHPWLNIIHPGPWTQLPPAPAPVPAPRTKFSRRCHGPKIVPPNPFAEDLEEETRADSAAGRLRSGGHRGHVSLNPFAEDMDQETETVPAVGPVSLSDGSKASNKSRVKGEVSLNPFAEDMDEDTVDKDRAADGVIQTRPAAAVQSGDTGGLTHKPEERDMSLDPFTGDLDQEAVDKVLNLDQTEPALVAAQLVDSVVVSDGPNSPGRDVLTVEDTDVGPSVSVPAGGPSGGSDQAAGTVFHDSTNTGGSLQNVCEAASAPAQGCILPRSFSVPAIPSSPCQSSSQPAEGTERPDQGSSQRPVVCRDSPHDHKHAIRKSKTCQSLPSRRGPAPGHGFPLIRRKVQSGQNVSTEDLRVEMRELDKHLQTLEQRGVQLEKSLRICKNDKEEEQMLVEWFSLVHERNALVCRDTELVYLTKQQKLEERQADVEFRLRCLLNKPEGEWSEGDRGEERELMKELVDIIEQRNQIISSLDQERIRDREEDLLLEDMKKNKELQREGLRDLRKSRGKFKAIKVLKLLNHKPDDMKD